MMSSSALCVYSVWLCASWNSFKKLYSSLWIVWPSYLQFISQTQTGSHFSGYTHFILCFVCAELGFKSICYEGTFLRCLHVADCSLLLPKHLRSAFVLCAVCPLEVKWVFPSRRLVFVAVRNFTGSQRTKSVSAQTQKCSGSRVAHSRTVYGQPGPLSPVTMRLLWHEACIQFLWSKKE